jgi:hypothetical protein
VPAEPLASSDPPEKSPVEQGHDQTTTSVPGSAAPPEDLRAPGGPDDLVPTDASPEEDPAIRDSACILSVPSKQLQSVALPGKRGLSGAIDHMGRRFRFYNPRGNTTRFTMFSVHPKPEEQPMQKGGRPMSQLINALRMGLLGWRRERGWGHPLPRWGRLSLRALDAVARVLRGAGS